MGKVYKTVRGKREGFCISRRLGVKEGEKGRRRHVCRSMIYRLHCHHGDFCQPSLRSKVVVQTAVPQSEGDAGWCVAEGSGEEAEEGGERWKGC